MPHKKLFTGILSLCILLTAATSCSIFDTNVLYDQLYGTWKCTYVVEHEVCTSESGITEKYDYDGPVTDPSNEYHVVLSFDNKRDMTILESGNPDEYIEYPLTLHYWLKGNMLYGQAFAGEIVNYSVIDTVDEKTLVISLTENGYDDDDDETIDYTRVMTFEKVN